jgi:hypothetical protein
MIMAIRITGKIIAYSPRLDKKEAGGFRRAEIRTP